MRIFEDQLVILEHRRFNNTCYGYDITNLCPRVFRGVKLGCGVFWNMFFKGVTTCIQSCMFSFTSFRHYQPDSGNDGVSNTRIGAPS